MRKNLIRASVALALLAAGLPAHSQSEARALEEVRNTVINLLQALVEKGVMTKEQAEAMVAAAQTKAAADAQARAAENADAATAVRVTYVPEVVRREISEQVRADMSKEVVQDVVAHAQAEGWGVPGALAPWVRDVKFHADVRARTEGALYADGNAVNEYLDFNAINEAGGVIPAGESAFLNTTEDRHRMVGRLRFGAKAQLGNDFGLEFRLASGNARSPVSTNQTLGNYGGRWEVNVDKAAVLWNPASDLQELDLRLGRFSNPFVSVNELVFDNDLSFEGVSATYALDVFGRDDARVERGLFATFGAFPLQEVELSSDDKWLYGAQLGLELPVGAASRLRFAAGYFDYQNITGVLNAFGRTDFDYTAPRFLQKGNTLFDIRNDDDEATELVALAGEYSLATASILLDFGFGDTHVIVGGEYVRNLAWDSSEVAGRTNVALEERTEGYEAGVSVGRESIAQLWDWRAFAFYRYLERDAVLDAFTDSDFHLGGTDAKGYQIGFDLGLSKGMWMRLRYLTADEIDGPPLGIDVWQLDWNGQF